MWWKRIQVTFCFFFTRNKQIIIQTYNSSPTRTIKNKTASIVWIEVNDDSHHCLFVRPTNIFYVRIKGVKWRKLMVWGSDWVIGELWSNWKYSGVVVSESGWEIGEPSSITCRVNFIHLRANTVGKGMYQSIILPTLSKKRSRG